jgi:oligopeptide/dipeptide ABC transporter ATP-binding protein
VEEATTEEIFDDPRHPYTLGLLTALPAFQAEKKVRRLSAIPGSPPDLRAQPSACPFLARCAYAVERCAIEVPALLPVVSGLPTNHRIACFVNTRERIAVV